ncbi:GNAT family N-acetyltransferase [Evansella cellulosilytica]|uniref:GCN5-related N-acetyltransferase n=1 Tax=Evansella cellulosilytica (strain ATCC 21833 / DSM 2522 / FERM P-1141 / JCM 9156 / N-4) TaxID=649639 RepID=E6TVD8_EVAC2|nr:GNAT family N-acetyltransferase [Evansella cellulosilytica]ADU30955.1 GCN5-related N-acetyltransferase [Evansella cellulosilytica DSM 2522]
MDVRVVETEQEMKDAYAVRRTVFIEEQGVPEEMEIDAHEDEAVHFVAYNDKGAPVGAGRMRLFDDYGKAERICVVRSYRKKGVGDHLMKKLEEVALAKGKNELKLNAQTHAEQFYDRIGYETTSDTFYEAGIPHVTMRKQLR